MNEDGRVADVVGYWLEKSTESLSSARDELAAGRHVFAVNRCYYFAFYAASAVLLSRGHRFRKHSGVRAALHQHLVKAGLLSSESGRTYDRLFHDRQEGDYLEFVDFTAEDVSEMIAAARRLLGDLTGLVPND